MFAAIGRSVFKYRYLVLVLWVAIVAGSAFFAPRVAGVLVTGGFENPNSESSLASKINREELNGGRAVLQIVFRDPGRRADDPTFIADERTSLDNVRDMDGVKSVITFEDSRNPKQISKDGHTTYAVVEFEGSADDVKKLLPDFKERFDPDPSFKTWIAGDPAVYADIETVSQEDLASAEQKAFPLSLLVLLLVYGTLVAAGMPVIIGFVSVTATLASIFLLAQGIDMSIFVMNMASMLGLAIGIDYSLLMVSRFREELKQQPDVEAALIRTVSTAGRSVVFSGLAVFIGLSGLLIFPFMNLRSMGIGGQIVVFFSVASSLTLLPAILGILGHRINSLDVRRPIRWLFRRNSAEAERSREAKEGRFWAALARTVMRFPIPVATMVVIFIAILALPVSRISVSVPDANVLPKGTESREGHDILTTEIGQNELSPVFLVIRTEGDALSSENIGRVFTFSKELEKIEGVKRVESYTTLVPQFTTAEQYRGLYADPKAIARPEIAKTLARTTNNDVTVVRVVLDSRDPISDEAHRTLEKVRDIELPGARIYVGGFTAGVADFIEELYGIFPYAIGLVFVLTYLVLLVLFRSVILPLKAVIMNTLSILASYGAMVFIFQEGRLEGLLDFTANGHIEATLPVIMFSALFGISMDYEIFLLSRVREAYEQTGDNRASVELGLQRTGRIITSAALIVVIVTGSFVLTDIVFIKAMGVGLALAILIDATIIRALLVPATMRLLGKWNWWAPKWMQPIFTRANWGD